MEYIGRTISEAIRENKWIDIKYKNKNNEITFYWIYVNDVSPNKTLKVTIFNDRKSLDTKEVYITFDNILSANIIDISTGENNDYLVRKIENNLKKYAFLEYEKFSINLLHYYKDCFNHDSDPALKTNIMIEGIDYTKLIENKYYKLSEEQNLQFINLIRNGAYYKSRKELSTFCLSALSVDKNTKLYVVCYYEVRYDPKRKVITINPELKFNNSFLNEGTKYSLYDYLDCEIEDYIKLAKNDFANAVKYLDERKYDGELISTRPVFYIQEFELKLHFDSLYCEIEQQYKNNNLYPPLKAFFGQMNASSYNRRKEPNICLIDSRINIDQMRVVYNALKYPVTYVQGPPGTGKTQTIINVVFSTLLNDKKCLISSQNNKPVDGIKEKLFFMYNNRKYLLPFLRLGNSEETNAAINKIKFIFEAIDNNKFQFDNQITSDQIDKIYLRNNLIKNKSLLDKIKRHEKRLELEGLKESLKHLIDSMTSNNYTKKRLTDKYDEVQKELLLNEPVTNKDIINLFIPVDKDKELQKYFYNIRIKCFLKLKEKKYEELRQICFDSDIENARLEFNKYIANDNKLKLLLDVFPIILTTNMSCDKLGEGKNMFDLLIIDESSQCNIATSLLAIGRSKALLLVGDPNQLRPIILLDRVANQKYKEKYHVSNEYDYCTNSILDVMRNADRISKYIFLRYHYRCGKKIINFSNKRYYHSNLLTDFVNNDGELVFLNCKNNNIIERNSAFEEANGIVNYIKRNDIKDAMIITPFVNQKNLLNKLLHDKNVDKSIEAGTIHSLQGSEKNVIIFSMAISPRTSKKTYEWLMNNAEVLNVGVTRAKKKLVVACDYESIEKLSDKKDDLYYLVNYVKENGNSNFIVPPTEKIEIGKSNSSFYEDEFFKTISQFCSVNRRFKAKRNVAIKDLFNEDKDLSESKQEFDCVLYTSSLLKTKAEIAIEINGGEHFGDYNKEKLDKRKHEICKKKGIKLLVIDNNYVKMYEEIKHIILQLAKDSRESEQLTLFD